MFDRFSALTFDCYGTLIDWEAGIVAALRPLLADHGVSQPSDRILELYGELEAEAEAGPFMRYHDVLGAVVDGFGRYFGFEPSDAERETFARSVPEWPAFEDSQEALGRLSKHFELAILSNVDDELFAGSARRLGAAFTHVITAEQVGSYKPNPRNFEVAIERVGRPREQILHVAQSLFHDIAPAREAGLATVWVNRRHGRAGHGATPPMDAEPDLEVPDLASLANMVEAALPSHGAGT
jgi:2-haloacid dehalogenase